MKNNMKQIETQESKRMYPQKTKFKNILIVSAILSATIFLVAAPSEKELLVSLSEKIDQFKSKILDENKYFGEFKKEKEQLLVQKEKELQAIDLDNATLQSEISALKRKIKEQELIMYNLEKENEYVNKQVATLCRSLVTDMDTSIPYDVERRKSILNSLIQDIESGKSDIDETFTRLYSFLQSEEMLAYDSQNYESVITVKDKMLKASVLRLGRVFFAADTGEEVYLFKKKDGKYFLDTEKPLSITQKRNVRYAMSVIAGKKAPELTDIPFELSQVEYEAGESK